MRIGDICTRNVMQTDAAMPLARAVETMRAQQVGTLVVVEAAPAGPTPVGIVTDRDIVMALSDSDNAWRELRVGKVMAPAPATCGEQDELFDVIALMRRRGIRRLPVVDRHGTLVGIVTTDDLLGALAEHLGELARTLVSDELIEMRRHGDR